MTRQQYRGVNAFDVLGRPHPRRSRRAWWITAYVALPVVLVGIAVLVLTLDGAS